MWFIYEDFLFACLRTLGEVYKCAKGQFIYTWKRNCNAKRTMSIELAKKIRKKLCTRKIDELRKYYTAHGNIINCTATAVIRCRNFSSAKFWNVCTFHKGATVFADNVSCSWCTICTIFPSHRQKYLLVVKIVYTSTILCRANRQTFQIFF